MSPGDDRPVGTVTWGELLAETRRGLRDDAAARWICEVASGADSMADVLDELATERAVALLGDAGSFRDGEPLARTCSGAGRSVTSTLPWTAEVLIPRPETEVVAGVALDVARSLLAAGRASGIVDLGTGSRAIGLALVDELPLGSSTVVAHRCQRRRARRRPRQPRRHRPRRVRPGRRTGEWFAPLSDELCFDIVVSNPPYVAVGTELLDDSVRLGTPHGAVRRRRRPRRHPGDRRTGC